MLSFLKWIRHLSSSSETNAEVSLFSQRVTRHYPFHYKMALAFSAILCPHIHRLVLRLAFLQTGDVRVYHVPHEYQSRLGTAFPPMVQQLRQRNIDPLNLTTYHFGSSLSASLACPTSRRLSAVHFHLPYYSILAPDCLDAGRIGYIVPKASHPVVTNDACFGRILLVAQQVMSCYQASQMFMRLRVAPI